MVQIRRSFPILRSLALALLLCLPLRVPAARAAARDDGAPWIFSGAGIDGGQVRALAISPAFLSDHTLFAGTAAGIYRSTDGGASWAINSTWPSYGQVRALAISPAYASDRAVFAGIVGAMDPGVWKSTDGGASWQVKTVDPAHPYVYAVAVSPQYAVDGTLFAGTGGGGVFKSTNAAVSWSPAPGQRPGQPPCIRAGRLAELQLRPHGLCRHGQRPVPLHQWRGGPGRC